MLIFDACSVFELYILTNVFRQQRACFMHFSFPNVVLVFLFLKFASIEKV